MLESQRILLDLKQCSTWPLAAAPSSSSIQPAAIWSSQALSQEAYQDLFFNPLSRFLLHPFIDSGIPCALSW